MHAAHLLQRGSQLALQDRADAKTSWRTYPSAGFAVPYHYNTETRASVWVTPPELAAALAEVDAEDEAARPRRAGQPGARLCTAAQLRCAVFRLHRRRPPVCMWDTWCLACTVACNTLRGSLRALGTDQDAASIYVHRPCASIPVNPAL